MQSRRCFRATTAAGAGEAILAAVDSVVEYAGARSVGTHDSFTPNIGITIPASESDVVGAPKIEVTNQMMEAGARALSHRYLDPCDGDEYPEIARIVFLAMAALLPVHESTGGQAHPSER
jgi:hypothetical protein